MKEGNNMSKIFEEIERRGWEEGYREGIQLGLKEATLLGKKEAFIYVIKQMMKEFAIDIEKAMNILNIPENEKDDYRKQLKH